MNALLSEVSQTSGETQWVVFCVAGSEMCVEIQQVREIIRVAEVTMMPRAPKFLEGIINLRGRIVPVLNLKRRFNMPPIDVTSESRILVVDIDDQMLGFLVDKVSEVLKSSLPMAEPSNETTLNISPEFMKGVLPLNLRRVFYLNLKKIFVFDDVKSLPE
jgi:purine-binding chemotaxis protein CheW